jgi:hypothetical protein
MAGAHDRVDGHGDDAEALQPLVGRLPGVPEARDGVDLGVREREPEGDAIGSAPSIGAAQRHEAAVAVSGRRQGGWEGISALALLPCPPGFAGRAFLQFQPVREATQGAVRTSWLFSRILGGPAYPIIIRCNLHCAPRHRRDPRERARALHAIPRTPAAWRGVSRRRADHPLYSRMGDDEPSVWNAAAIPRKDCPASRIAFIRPIAACRVAFRSVRHLPPVPSRTPPFRPGTLVCIIHRLARY